jgi:hypothetical protein
MRGFRDILPCYFSLWEKARMRETPATTGHLRTLTPTLSQREREKGQLADNALNARLPRHFADGRSEEKARGVG